MSTVTKEEALEIVSNQGSLFVVLSQDAIEKLRDYVNSGDADKAQANNDELIRAQFVAAALAEAWGCPKFAVEANDVGDAVMAEFIKRREARRK